MTRRPRAALAGLSIALAAAASGAPCAAAGRAAQPPPATAPAPPIPGAPLRSAPAPVPAPAPLPASRATLLAAINRERAAAGARPLALSRELDRVAEARAAEIARRGAIPGPTDSNELYRIEHQIVATGYRPQGWTESLTVTTGDADVVVSFWKQGDSFQAAMSRDYADVGVGIASVQGVPLYEFLFAWPQREVYARRVAGLTDLAAVRKEMFERVNAARAAAGLEPVLADPRLNTAAQKHADDMLVRGYYNHLTPEGLTPRDRVEDAGLFSSLVAENIAEGEFSVDEVMDGWMKSAGHRANILNPRMTSLGIGLAVGRFEDRLRLLWVQEFARQGF
jgi:uncharacterized protein YkwD